MNFPKKQDLSQNSAQDFIPAHRLLSFYCISFASNVKSRKKKRLKEIKRQRDTVRSVCLSVCLTTHICVVRKNRAKIGKKYSFHKYWPFCLESIIFQKIVTSHAPQNFTIMFSMQFMAIKLPFASNSCYFICFM